MESKNELIIGEDKKILLQIARDSIASKLGLCEMKDDYGLSGDAGSLVLGAFVTLHIKGNLRGCIGYIMGVAGLYDTIFELARSAAFSDPRFSPLSKTEYDNIDIEISLLSPISEVNSIDEILVGRDGLIVTKGYNRGLLLPQVPVEQGWELEEFLSHTCMKAGLMPDTWRKEKIKIEKFSAEVFSEFDFNK